jgi:hypothetical protein
VSGGKAAKDAAEGTAKDAEVRDRITPAKMQDYLGKTERALAKVTLRPTPGSPFHRGAEDMVQMARAYFEDARHYAAKGDLVTAFAAINYAHAWLDIGVRLGLLDGHGDDHLFTLP